MHQRWLKLGLLLIILAIVVSPCIFCWWLFDGYNNYFKTLLPVYKRAQPLTNAYNYFGGAAAVTLYYWTSESVDKVRTYYETFTPSFIKSPYWFNTEIPEHYRTVFNPYNQPLPIITAEFSHEIIHPAESYFCHYRIPYQCVEVELIDFGEAQPVILRPPPGPARQIITPEPVRPSFKGGTLIVYIYYVEDHS